MADLALITKAKRALVETAIEQLISILDELDGDCDLEDNNDLEPSLLGPCRMGKDGKVYSDLESESTYTDFLDEPSLGWTLDVNQDSPHYSGRTFFDDAECDLATVRSEDGTGRYMAHSLLMLEGEDERELDPAESGVSDYDALDEVFPGHAYGAVL